MKLHEELAVTAELTGTALSEGAALVMAAELAEFDQTQVSSALKRCRHELRGRLTLSEIIRRIDDGRPGAEEAWAIALRAMDEEATLVWTDEVAQAWGICRAVYDSGDKIAARMTFKEAYIRIVEQNKRDGVRVVWTASLGHDADAREEGLRLAVDALSLPAPVLAKLPAPEDVARHDGDGAPAAVREALRELRAKLSGSYADDKYVIPPEVARHNELLEKHNDRIAQYAERSAQ